MKKKVGAMITALILCLCLLTPSLEVQAASGKTTLAVSASTLSVGDTLSVTAKAFGASGEAATAAMVLTYNTSVLEFVSCSTTYAGGSGTVSASGNSFTVKLKAIAAGTASLSLAASNGTVTGTGASLEAVEGSSTKVTVGAAAPAPTEKPAASEVPTGTVTPAASETVKQSADNSLRSLSLSAGTLSPSFSGRRVNYTASVPNNVTEVTVSAKPVNDKATVESITGNTGLSVGTNTIKVTVKAENGALAVYKIVLTRQAEAAAKPAETTPASEKPSNETPAETPAETPETTGLEISVNGVAYQIAGELPTEGIPTGFSETTLDWQGNQVKGLTTETGAVSLLYLIPSDPAAGTEGFYVYNAADGSTNKFIQLTSGTNYVVALPLASGVAFPDESDYQTVELPIGEASGLEAYQKLSTDGTVLNPEFYLFYAVNQAGMAGWYQYDSTEGTYQRFANGENEAMVSAAEYQSLQADYQDISTKYKDERVKFRNLIAILAFIIALLLIICLNLFIGGRKRRSAKKRKAEGISRENTVDRAHHPVKKQESKSSHTTQKQVREQRKPARETKAPEPKQPKTSSQTEDDMFFDGFEVSLDEAPVSAAQKASSAAQKASSAAQKASNAAQKAGSTAQKTNSAAQKTTETIENVKDTSQAIHKAADSDFEVIDLND